MKYPTVASFKVLYKFSIIKISLIIYLVCLSANMRRDGTEQKRDWNDVRPWIGGGVCGGYGYVRIGNIHVKVTERLTM